MNYCRCLGYLYWISWFAVSRKTTSEALPEYRPSCRLCSGQGIRFAGYPDHLRSQHSTGKTQILPRRPRNGFLPQSRRRDMTATNRSANGSPLPFPTRKPVRLRSTNYAVTSKECCRISPPGVPNAAPSSTPPAQQLNACPILMPLARVSYLRGSVARK